MSSNIRHRIARWSTVVAGTGAAFLRMARVYQRVVRGGPSGAMRSTLVGLCGALVLIAVPSAYALPPANCSTCRLPTNPAPGVVTQLPPVTYREFPTDNHAGTETLIPWQGEYVSVLVDPGVTRSARVMTKLVSALDRAWYYYYTTTGFVPAPAYSLNGRAEVAEVPVATTCGAGCTHLGETGTEIDAYYFELMYHELAQNGLYDQIPFYEFGRSFWHWSPQLQFHPAANDPVVTGFAVWMRFRSMAAAGVQGAPLDVTHEPFSTLASDVDALVGEYEADPTQTFAQTLAIGQAPSPSNGLHGTDFYASLMAQLAERHGGQTFVSRFWHDVAGLHAAPSTAGAVTNWVLAANYAACTNLDSVFYTRWGFPRPNGRVTRRPRASLVPEPRGACKQR